MSTLTTRIAGFKFTMRPATGEEIASHKQTSIEQGWALCPDYSRAMVGNFVSETGNVMDLPYELRITRMLVQPDVMLQLFNADYETFIERILFHDSATCMTDTQGFGCEKDTLIDADYARRYMNLRGFSWKFKQNLRKRFDLLAKYDSITLGLR